MANIGYYKTEVKNPRSGDKMYSVRLATYSLIDSEQVVAAACKVSNIKKHDMAVGFAALCQAIEDFVLQGHSVTLDGLGNFRLTAKSGKWDEENKKWVSGGSDNMDDVTPEKIRGVYVRFRPSREVRAMLRKTQFFDCTKTKFGGTMGNYNYTEVTK